MAARPDVDAIDEALMSGTGVRVVAKRFGLGKSAVGAHRRDCLKLEGRLEAVEPLEELSEPANELPLTEDDPADIAPDSRRTPIATCPRTSGDDARASRPDCKSLVSFQDRSLYIADMIVRGRWLGRPTVKRLAAVWDVDSGAVQNYHRAACVVTRADRGALDEQREASIGATLAIRERARKAAEKSQRLIDECRSAGKFAAEAIARKALADDRKAELAAQAHIDRIAGVVANQAPTVVNVFASPDWTRLRDLILEALVPHPEALADVVAAIERAQTGGGGGGGQPLLIAA